MPSTKPPPESRVKVGENGSTPTTIESFRKLTKELLAVTPEELAEEERRYKAERRKAR